MTTTLPTADADSRAVPVLSIEDLLRDQQTLPGQPVNGETAVETFSRLHEEADREQESSEARPEQERYYKSLIPATPPASGEQFAFEVDLDACSGCKACVAACHSLNGLDDDEAWRDVGLLHSAPQAESMPSSRTAEQLLDLPVLQHVTTACHHCLDPGCLKGCPVNAYEKDPLTGIVRHLDDQCFGCQYCTLMCPYEVPKYNADLGIVRKCDMCSGRLAAGEAPACVQACPHEAIRIRTVSVAGVQAKAAKASVCNSQTTFAIPHSPPVRQTVPTTLYKTERLDLSKLEPADLRTPKPAHAHGPLTVMLALTQLGVGGLVAAAVLALLGVAPQSVTMKTVTAGGFVLLNIGLIAATLHLGRPHLAFRAVLGWRHSWLSREAIAFGAFMPTAAASVAVAWLDWIPFAGKLPVDLTGGLIPMAVFAAAAIAGLGAVFTSVMIYVAARKPLWSFPTTTLRFLLTTLLGAAGLTVLGRVLGGSAAWAAGFALAVAVGVKLLLDSRAMLLADDDISARSHSARLLRGPLRKTVNLRLLLSVGGFVVASIGIAIGSVAVAGVGVAAAFGGELIERWLFFTAVAGPKMPGGLPR